MHGKFHALDVGEISLWHPIGCDVAEVLAWRERLNALGIVQPFKQAHREVYLITMPSAVGTYTRTALPTTSSSSIRCRRSRD